MKTKGMGTLKLALVASLTLGLAPFVPEPHIVGKIRWIAGGARGMQLIDWLDALMHGTPWLVLIGSSVYVLANTLKGRTGDKTKRGSS